MLDIQLGKRNLSPVQRIAVVEKYRPIYERQAQKNQSKAGGDKKSENYKKSVVTNSSQVISNGKERNPTVRKILSNAADVSEDTYSKGKKFFILMMKHYSKKCYQEKNTKYSINF